jgi:hypothetical protein
MSMFDLTQLSDDDLRAALFDALVERLDATVKTDPSISLVNRMPTVLAIGRQGHLLTLSQGLGLCLLRGVLKSKDGRERLRTFNVGRATIQSRLVITPVGIAGTPDEILDWIVTMFMERSAPVEQGPAAVIPPAKPRPPAESRTTETPKAEATPPRPAPTKDKKVAMPNLRTYQLLLETAQHELKVAKALPVDRRKYFLISAGVCVALTAEAFLNDLGSSVISSWGQLQRLDPREKAEVLNIELFKEKVDWSVSPFQSVAAALGFRRALAHAHAETLAADNTRTAERSGSEVPRTRRTAWQEHCDVATMQRWTTDVRHLIDHFSRGVSPAEAAAGQEAGTELTAP